MTIGGFLVLLVIAFICGAIAQTLAGGGRGGCLVTIAVGFVGALIGSWIAKNMGLPELLSIDVGGGERFPIVWSVMGGALFCAVIGFLTRRAR
jgi:uncharacterized membrane protein YeaQ/YmgE (transglycosylase-associated protein family)